MKKGVFFDLYGTLIDIITDEYDYRAYEMLSRYLAYHSVNISPEELKCAFFGGIQHHLRQNKEAYPEVDVYKVFFDIMNRYGKKKYSKGIITDISMLFRSLTIRQFGVFDGVYDSLLSLNSKYKIAIISDAQWVFAEPEIEILAFDQFFKNRILSSKYGFKKPDIRLFQVSMDKLGVSPGESVYIGDNLQKDITGAKKAGMKFILFRSGCNGYNGFQPDACFYHYTELEDILMEIM